MPISFASAGSHVPGMTAWPDAAPPAQKDVVYEGYDRLRRRLEASATDVLILLTSEHWANFFMDHISPFCVGRGEYFAGPVEPWLKVEKAKIAGDPSLAAEIIETCNENGVELGFAYEMELDHGTMVPLSFLTPAMNYPMVPIMFNTLAAPQPTARRCLELGRVLGRMAERSDRRIGFIATGGLSHDPGERNHGVIDSEFDRRFLSLMEEGDMKSLAQYTSQQFAAAGAGAFELLSWVALAGVLNGCRGEVIAYEAVKPWATGIGLVGFDLEDRKMIGAAA